MKTILIRAERFLIKPRTKHSLDIEFVFRPLGYVTGSSQKDPIGACYMLK